MKKQLLLLALMIIMNVHAFSERSAKESCANNCKKFEEYLDFHQIDQKLYHYFKERLEKKKLKSLDQMEKIEHKQQELYGKRDLKTLFKGSLKFVGGIISAAIVKIQSSILGNCLCLGSVLDPSEHIDHVISEQLGDTSFNDFVRNFMFTTDKFDNFIPTSISLISIIGLFGLSSYLLYSGYYNIKFGLKPALAFEKDKEKIMQKLKEIKCKEKVLEESRAYYRST